MGVSRRRFIKAAGIVAGATLLPATGLAEEAKDAFQNDGPADYTLTIADTPVEIAPKKIISMTTYNGQFPGPLLRLKEGQQVTVDIINSTDVPEQLHWHGQIVPVDIDGAAEEGTPFVPARGKRRIHFVPQPSGYRFYHTHNRAGAKLFAGHTADRSGTFTSSQGANLAGSTVKCFLS